MICLEEAVETHHIEYIAQKARKEVEAKMREKAKKQRLVEEKKKKKQIEDLQELWNKILAEDTALLEAMEGSQVMGTKHKEIISENEKR